MNRIRASIILVAALFAGCGRDHPKPVQVRGNVVGPKGKPIGPAVVIFWAENSKNNSGATAVCEADGSFSLQCLPGNYKATVSPIRAKGSTQPPDGSDSSIPKWYQSEVTTTLSVRVPAAGAENVVLKLKSMPDGP